MIVIIYHCTLSCGWDKRHIVSCDPLKDASWLPVRAQRSVKCMCNSPETFLLVKIAFAPSSAMLSLPSLLFHYMAYTHQQSCDRHFWTLFPLSTVIRYYEKTMVADQTLPAHARAEICMQPIVFLFFCRNYTHL